MPYGIEFAGGIVCFAVGAACLAVALRLGGAAHRIAFWAAIAIDVCVFLSLLLDWGYSWVEWTAIAIAMERSVWIASPHLVALLTLLGLAAWGSDFAPHAVFLCALQSLLLQVVSVVIAPRLDVSLLAAAPIAATYLAALASFLMVAPATAVIPARTSKWHAVAFGPRAALMDAIASLAALGLRTRPAATVCESGSAVGIMGGRRVRVSTEPAVLPPGYALRIEVELPPGSNLDVAKPGFAPVEEIDVGPSSVRYLGRTKVGFDVSDERLIEFIKCCTGAER